MFFFKDDFSNKHQFVTIFVLLQIDVLKVI
jgi:hypothetical protein